MSLGRCVAVPPRCVSTLAALLVAPVIALAGVTAPVHAQAPQSRAPQAPTPAMQAARAAQAAATQAPAAQAPTPPQTPASAAQASAPAGRGQMPVPIPPEPPQVAEGAAIQEPAGRASDTVLMMPVAIAPGAEGLASPPDVNVKSLNPDIGITYAIVLPPFEGDEVIAYLWGVYMRSGTKTDSRGDFTWKDAVAASRMEMSVAAYVIGGMDADFREQLFQLGHALDATGINWTILSGFRDDYRQNLAVGLKAHAGNSFHGGSTATGGYGHGCAIDIGGTDNDAVWDWLGKNSEKFGIYRPLPRADPAHLQARGPWHQLGARLRGERTGGRGEPKEGNDPQAAGFGGVSPEQYGCVRGLLAGDPGHGFGRRGWAHAPQHVAARSRVAAAVAARHVGLRRTSAHLTRR
jgi:hypothetical protein